VPPRINPENVEELDAASWVDLQESMTREHSPLSYQDAVTVEAIRRLVVTFEASTRLAWALLGLTVALLLATLGLLAHDIFG
jgi:hypothetical protein